jgi:hypothetical protein
MKMSTQTNQATKESIAKSNAALARLMGANVPATIETVTKIQAKRARLAEQDKVLAAKTQMSSVSKQDPSMSKAAIVKAAAQAVRKVAVAAMAKKVMAADIAKAKVTSIGAALDAGKTLTAKSAKALVTERKAIVAAKAAMRAGLPALNPSVEAVSAGVARVAAKAATVAPAKKPNVKVAILDLFYANPNLQLSTRLAVEALQHQYAGMNESSIRVWITDFRNEGTLVKVDQVDGKDILQAGTPGEKWALRGTQSQFAIANKGRKAPAASPKRFSDVKAGGVALPVSLQNAVAMATKSFEKLMVELNRFAASKQS